MRRDRGTRRGFVPECVGLEGRQLLSATAARATPSLFVEPDDGRGPLLAAIASARSRIRLGICNLSDPTIGDALIAAEGRGVDVRAIVDRADYAAKAEERTEVDMLVAGGVEVHLSNTVFPQSFEKLMVIDRRTAVVMTMCLVPLTFEDTRDYGLVVSDPGVIREATSVFDTDWAFSAPPGSPTPAYNPTPPLRSPSLIWGPTDATAKLSRLIGSARRSIDATSELLGDPYLEGQLIAAASRGVRVRLIAPIVARGDVSNADDVAFLLDHGIDVRVTTEATPPPDSTPYMHAKTMIVDGRTAEIGSIDLATAPATRDRELAIVFRQRAPVARLRQQFARDWAAAIVPEDRA